MEGENMDRYIFTIGNFKIEWYSFLIVIGAILGLSLIHILLAFIQQKKP